MADKVSVEIDGTVHVFLCRRGEARFHAAVGIGELACGAVVDVVDGEVCHGLSVWYKKTVENPRPDFSTA